jgi:cell division protein FtsI/penicillin-binding protein 2
LGYNSLNRAYYPPQNPLYTFAEEAYLFNENIDLLPLQMTSDMAQKRLSNLLDRRSYDILNPFSSEMPSNRLHPSDLSRVGIGQFDIRITPLEAAFILSIIANDGIRHLPRLVKAIHGVQPSNPLWKEEPRSQIENIEFLPDKGKRVISPKTARELKKMMQKVVTDGTASYEFKYSTLNDNVAGKTGTPTAPDMTSKYHAIFGAIAPIIRQANKPQVALAVFVEYGDSASIEAVPIARRILEKVAVYYGWR